MVGLESSKWAASTARPATRTAPIRPVSRADELERHRRLLRRLRWKLPYLADSHLRATVPESGMTETDRREAELMFKLDFFEYYVLLERSLLHLLAVFNITVSAYSNVRTTLCLTFYPADNALGVNKQWLKRHSGTLVLNACFSLLAPLPRKCPPHP